MNNNKSIGLNSPHIKLKLENEYYDYAIKVDTINDENSYFLILDLKGKKTDNFENNKTYTLTEHHCNDKYCSIRDFNAKRVKVNFNDIHNGFLIFSFLDIEDAELLVDHINLINDGYKDHLAFSLYEKKGYFTDPDFLSIDNRDKIEKYKKNISLILITLLIISIVFSLIYYFTSVNIRIKESKVVSSGFKLESNPIYFKVGQKLKEGKEIYLKPNIKKYNDDQIKLIKSELSNYNKILSILNKQLNLVKSKNKSFKLGYDKNSKELFSLIFKSEAPNKQDEINLRKLKFEYEKYFDLEVEISKESLNEKIFEVKTKIINLEKEISKLENSNFLLTYKPLKPETVIYKAKDYIEVSDSKPRVDFIIEINRTLSDSEAFFYIDRGVNQKKIYCNIVPANSNENIVGNFDEAKRNSELYKYYSCYPKDGLLTKEDIYKNVELFVDYEMF